MAAKEEKERLATVHQQDLNEGRINEDFVTWLKTKGPTWLLIILAFVVAYLVMIRWQQQDAQARNAAWIELLTTSNPASLEDVARIHAEVDGVSNLARLMAANSLMDDIQRGTILGDDGQTRVPMDDATRAAHLKDADRIYAAIAADDDGSEGQAWAAVSAMNGRAAVAECRGELENASTWYNKAATRADGWLPALAAQARHRAATVNELEANISFATQPPAASGATLPEGLTILPPGSTPPTPKPGEATAPSP